MRSIFLRRPCARALAVPALVLLLAPPPALAARGAAISLPEDFAAAATAVPVTGFGGFNRGDYEAAEFHGEFTRIESRLGVFDPVFAASRGRSGFTIEDLDGAGPLAADCRALERTTTLGIVTLDLKKLVYACSFSGPAAAGPMQFLLGEPKREGFREKLMARDRRAGEAALLGHEFSIHSVHDYAGSKLGSQTPLGYLIESGGRVVAAVDLLDWNPLVHLGDGLSSTERQAAMIVALALAVLRDPANSALAD